MMDMFVELSSVTVLGNAIVEVISGGITEEIVVVVRRDYGRRTYVYRGYVKHRMSEVSLWQFGGSCELFHMR